MAILEGRYFKTSEARRHTVAELLERYRDEVLADKAEARRRDHERHLAWWEDRIGSYLLAD